MYHRLLSLSPQFRQTFLGTDDLGVDITNHVYTRDIRVTTPCDKNSFVADEQLCAVFIVQSVLNASKVPSYSFAIVSLSISLTFDSYIHHEKRPYQGHVHTTINGQLCKFPLFAGKITHAQTVCTSATTSSCGCRCDGERE